MLFAFFSIHKKNLLVSLYCKQVPLSVMLRSDITEIASCGTNFNNYGPSWDCPNSFLLRLWEYILIIEMVFIVR